MINGTKWNLIIGPKHMEFSSQYFTGTVNTASGQVSRTDMDRATAINLVNTAVLKTQIASTKAAAQASLITRNPAINPPVNASAAAAVSAASAVSNDTLVRVGFDNRFDGKGITDTMIATGDKLDRFWKAAVTIKNQYNYTSTGGNSDWYIPSIYELNALYYAAKPEDTDSSSTSYTANPMDVGPPDRTASDYSEPATQTKRRSFQIVGDKIGAHAFRTDIPYMSSTMNWQKTHVYAISFNDGSVIQRPVGDTLLIRPIRRTSA